MRTLSLSENPEFLEVIHLFFFAVVGIQLLYFIIYIVALSKTRAEKPTQRLPVSVIICAHDEEQNLRVLIPLLLEQDHPEFEVIIVDDDETVIEDKP